MIDTSKLDALSEQLSSVIPESVKTIKKDIETNIRSSLESGLNQMNLVSREEFDVQSALLEKLQQRISELEAQIEKLENAN